jgi:hypothetical protein
MASVTTDACTATHQRESHLSKPQAIQSTIFWDTMSCSTLKVT